MYSEVVPLCTPISSVELLVSTFTESIYILPRNYLLCHIYMEDSKTCILICVYDFKMIQNRWLVKYVRALYKYKLVHRVKLSSG